MKMKKLYILGLLALMIFAISGLADSTNNTITAITITAPESSAYVTDTYTFTGAFTGNLSAEGSINVTYNNTFICADTTGLSDVTSGMWSCVGSLSGVDAGECVALTLNASAYNGTDVTNVDTTATSIYSDATDPVLVSTSGFDKHIIEYQKENTYRGTMTDTCNVPTSFISATLTRPDGVTVSPTITKSNTATTGTMDFSFQSTDVDMIGEYSLLTTVFDSASNTDTQTVTFDVKGSDDGVSIPIVSTKTSTPSSFNMGFPLIVGFGALVVVLFAVLGYFWMNKK